MCSIMEKPQQILYTYPQNARISGTMPLKHMDGNRFSWDWIYVTHTNLFLEKLDIFMWRAEGQKAYSCSNIETSHGEIL